MAFAEVIVDISAEELNRGFSYRIPEEMEADICVGSFVKIPFGNSSRKGYVIAITDSCSYDESKIKNIKEIVTDNETCDSKMVALASWMSDYYSCNLIQALKTTLPARKKVRSRTKKSEIIGNDEGGSSALTYVNDRPALNAGQSEAYDRIRSEWAGANRPCLIHGVTGSGKTHVYMRLIEDVIAEGNQAIVLIPEIALTYQTVNRFVDRFGEQVSFLNSRMSQGEKYKNLKLAKSGEIKIMIGPRSALFTPFSKLGLIIIDEEHEESYRSESAPRYHARETAIKRAELEGAHIVLGSATPSLEAYSRAENEEYCLVELKERFGKNSGTSVECVDMREELQKGNSSFLSEKLWKSIDETLEAGHQAMLFLNRRGYAGFISCRSCGFVYKCPHCDISLTEHNNGQLVCHYCGYKRPKEPACPKCGSKAIGGMKIGTEQVEEFIKKNFPKARVARMDMDTTGGKEGHAKILSKFASGEANVLIGTQMIVKGHDYPNVDLVGILMADLSLNDHDFRAAEKTFQLITQAIGRTGRGDLPGKAIIQTYDTEHYAIEAASRCDYESFYRDEMLFRSMLSYPPSGTMMAVLGSGKDLEKLEMGMGYLRKYINIIDKNEQLEVIGPAPMAVRKIKDVYREVIYIRHKDHDLLNKVAEMMIRYVEINKGFDDMTIQYDFN